MSFDCDAFISYTHIDNIGLIDGSKGWITSLHRALEIRIAQMLGEEPQIWRDPKLSGNDIFEITLVEKLQRVAALVAVVSPRYVKSEWTRRELLEFLKAAELQGGVNFHDKARIFKVLKTPVAREMEPPQLAPLLGYQFFDEDPVSGRVKELSEVFGLNPDPAYWSRLDDLAHDIAALLEALRREHAFDGSKAQVHGAEAEAQKRKAVFLAETTSDLKDKREALRRDLQQHGYTVLPARGLSLIEQEVEESLEEDLAQCCMSIHLIGNHYGLIPEGSRISLEEIQNELAIARSGEGRFVRILWIPSGMVIEDDRQAQLIEHFRKHPGLPSEADMLETSFEEMKTVVYARLEDSLKNEKHPPVSQPPCHKQIYLIYDQRDASTASLYADSLFTAGFEVLHPSSESDEAAVRECHDENLRICDGVVLFFGVTSEAWVRRKMREIQKSVGYGRAGPLPLVAVTCLMPRTPEKDRFRTHEALLISQTSDFSPELLRPFISGLGT